MLPLSPTFLSPPPRQPTDGGVGGGVFSFLQASLPPPMGSVGSSPLSFPPSDLFPLPLLFLARWWSRRTCAHQLAAEQPLTECWITPKKDTPCPRAKEKPQKDGRRGEIMFTIKPHTWQRCLEAQTKLCVHQDPETPQRQSQTCLSLLWRYRSAVACYRGRGSGCSRPGSCSVWHKPSWRRSPLTPP